MIFVKNIYKLYFDENKFWEFEQFAKNHDSNY